MEDRWQCPEVGRQEGVEEMVWQKKCMGGVESALWRRYAIIVCGREAVCSSSRKGRPASCDSAK